MTLLSYFVKDAQFASNRKSNPDSRFDMVHGDPEDLSTCPGLCSSPTVRAGSSETVLLGGGQVKGTEHSKPAWRRLYSNPQLANLKEQEISPPPTTACFVGPDMDCKNSFGGEKDFSIYTLGVTGHNSNKCIASSNRCLTTSNKKLVETSATLVVTGASLVVTSPSLVLTGAFRVDVSTDQPNQTKTPKAATGATAPRSAAC